MKPQESTGRIAVVSGAMGYVGKAVSAELAKNGMLVALLYHGSEKSDVDAFIKKLADVGSIQNAGHRGYQCNLENPTEVATTLSQIEKEMGPMYACVQTAGMKPVRKSLLDTTAEEFEAQLRVNAAGNFNFLTQCGKRLKNQKQGVLIGITTIGVVSPQSAKSFGGYIPAKFAAQGILTMLREELRASGVRVYSVAPGFMPGGMNSDIPEAFKKMAELKNPSKKLTTDADIAEKISYLCSDAAQNENKLTHVVAEEYSGEEDKTR